MLANLFGILDTVTTGSLFWVGIIFLLAFLGELGFPVTCPVLESLLIFTGFQVTHGEPLFTVLPFLAITFIGRLCGATAAYWLSYRLGGTIISRFGNRFRITPERLEQVTQKLKSFTLPAIIVARFTPGFNVASSIACGVARISYRHFLIAVVIHLLAWEAIFLAFGALGGKVSKSFTPESSVIMVLIWIAIALTAGAIVAYLAHRRVKNWQ